jgi:hypothetical protein
VSTNWFTDWHGTAQIPTANLPAMVSGGGSTTPSTGLLLALSTKASMGHTHPGAEVTGLASTLAGLAAAISTKAAGVHTHATADVSSLASTLAGLAAAVSTKAAGVHTHVTGEVTGLDSTLAGLASAVSTKAAGVHTHVMANVTDLRTGAPSTWAVCSTHLLTGSTTMQSVTGLSFAVSSAAVYQFEFLVGWQTTSSAAGIALGINGPASPLLLAYGWAASTGFGPVVTASHRTFGAQTVPTAGSSAANVDMVGTLSGVLRTGANAGTLQLQYASEVAGSTVSVRAGSVGFLVGAL